ncbi:MAG: DUF3034 family protein [Planctomycetaceae bacterium]|nr:DUF3034 family protein [Planctomycetaceae bacterium]
MAAIHANTSATMFCVALIITASIARAEEPVDDKKPPLPFHTIEGVGGGAITPMAYLVNPAGEDDIFGKPAVAASYVGLGSKNLDALTITENLWGRVEVGFAADRLGLGTLPTAIQQATAIDIERSDVWLYHFNVRGLVVKENADDNPWVPAVTAGADFKTNEGIRDINTKLGGALNNLGYARENGVDFTLTATKTLPKAFFGKPLIASAGLRESEAADLGFLGFTNDYHPSFEGNLAILPFDKWLFAYEFRQHSNPFGSEIPGLIGAENSWNAFDAAYIMSKHATLVAGYGIFGNLANTEANSAWWLQLKYEF